MVALADLYRRGTGRRSDAARAFEWYQRAAKAGNVVAQMNLSEMYLNGGGTKLDRILAWVRFDHAASNSTTPNRYLPNDSEKLRCRHSR